MKTVLITGANRGIGLEHTRRFASRGVKVYATARAPDEAKDLQALARAYSDFVTVLPYDASAPDAAHGLKAALGDVALDLFLANAGVMGGKRQSFGSVDIEEVIDTLRINALAPLQLAEALADNVARSQRKLMGFQSSLMGSVGDNGSGGYYGYRIAKAALNMIAKGVSNDLRGRGVIAVALHPGWVQTRMGGASAPVTIERCVEGQQNLLDGLTLARSGKFYNYDGRELPW
jgi:NAD(P)-dependent dehydrogenase (short-subunit alcohol dehydrogenase family)